MSKLKKKIPVNTSGIKKITELGDPPNKMKKVAIKNKI